MSGIAPRWRWALPMAAVIVLADVITKGVVQARFAYGERMEVTDFFNLVFVLNPGAAFSFLASAGGWQKPILLALGAIASAAIAVYLVRSPMNRFAAFGFAAILGGAVGNVIDRARHGAVVDWLDFHLAGWHWPAFNVADIGITIGAAALIFDAMFVSPRKSAAQGAPR
jgi:signal peptidase II